MTKKSKSSHFGGFIPNEVAVLTGTQKLDMSSLCGFPYGTYSSDHPRYRELMEEYPPIKEAVLEMQSAIDRSPFKGVIGVGIRESGATFWVFRNYSSTKRFVNRVKAHSESYERLRKHLVPLSLMCD